MKRILIACEFSGVVREAFTAAGWEAWSCDLLPSSVPSARHLQCDVRTVLGQGWDMMIAHPPCTYLSGSGMHWTTRGLRDPRLTDEALDFVRLLLGAPIPRIALENPVGVISTRLRRPDQVVQPYDFGDDASKKTCLWLVNLPKLVPTLRVAGRKVALQSGRIVERWSNQTDSGQNRLGPSNNRWAERSVTYRGIAFAMAKQWS